MRRAALLAVAILVLAGCAGRDPDAPPDVKLQPVSVAVAVPCHTDTKKQRPALMTMPELKAAVAAAPNVDTKAKILSSQLLLHMGWLPVTEAAISGCDQRADPPAKPRPAP